MLMTATIIDIAEIGHHWREANTDSVPTHMLQAFLCKLLWMQHGAESFYKFITPTLVRRVALAFNFTKR